MTERAARRNHADIARRYAEDVINGRIDACKYVRQACARHLRDLSNQEDERFAFYFDRSKANRACRFVENCVHVKGKWARQGDRRIRLEPWQSFITASLFGWLRKADDTRRFREGYVEVPRKNAKSTWSAGIGNFMLLADDEPGAEVYSGATTERQAWEVFGPARQMVLRSPGMRAHYNVTVGAKCLSQLDTASKFEPLIGKPGDGASPHCAIVDEYHEHPTDELFDTMLTGMGARTQPLLLVITTAGSNIEGPCHQKRSQVIRILDGQEGFENDELFGVIYTVDDDDDWQDFSVWKKANPNFGVSVLEDFLQARHRDAVQMTAKRNAILTKNLNIWQNVGTAWCNILAWDACKDDTLRREDFEGQRCWIAVDLASRQDMAAVVTLFRDGDRYAVFCDKYLPEATIEQPQNEHYRRWRDEGWLTETDGEVIDFDRIEDDVFGHASSFEVVEVPYDPFQATQFATHLMERGLQVVEVGATVKNFSEPMKELEALILAGKIRHNGDPCLRWMMSNVVARVDAKDNIFPRKECPENKIDGPVALIMALSRAMHASEGQGVAFEWV